MIVIIGLLVLAAAVVVAAAGIATNLGGGHALGDNVTIFGQHVTGLSAGQLFACGIAVGIVGMLGLSILLGAFTRRVASRRSQRELKGSRTESESLRLDRDRLAQQLDDEHTGRAGVDAAGDPATTNDPAQEREPDLAQHPVAR